VRPRAVAAAAVLLVGSLAGLPALSVAMSGRAAYAASVGGGAPGPVRHPMGNIAVNQYAGLWITPEAVLVDYVLDLAELPAFQARRNDIDVNHDDVLTATEQDAYAARTCRMVAGDTRIRVNGRSAPARVTATALSFPPGTAGLVTLRLECALRVGLVITRQSTVDYSGGAFADRIGWNEVTAVGDGTTLVSSDVPTDSASARLTAYPVDALTSPSNVTAASLVVTPGGPSRVDGPPVPGHPVTPTRAGPAPVSTSERATPGVDRFTRWFTDLVGVRRLSLGLAVIGVLLALFLGGAHAMAPGHGKTIMAAYLVAERGRLRHALAVAATVAATHTAGVVVLGVLLATSLRFAPDRIYGWLGIVSGLLIAGVGLTSLRRALRARHPHHPHATDGGHHTHDHPHPGSTAPRLRALMAMGFAGGLSPSPSAVAVLLGAAALGRAWFGVLLVAVYGVGMAAVLTGVGYALARWSDVLQRRLLPRLDGPLRRLLPFATSGLILVVGLGLVLGGTLSISP
jgi:nickel/cobalt exporter